ncbi:hypothetical protein [Agrobacterium sp. 22117]|uniref:hypothetical protein n=1 Tax=Agrobacterium sp. 22117 TaxID=3453880 RepID=UPI003F835C84
MGITAISNEDKGASIRQKLNRLLSMFTENRYTLDTAPGITDDSAAGFEVGSKWLNKSTGIEYICRDATAGAASWVRQDNADFFGYVSNSYYHGVNGVVSTGAAITGGNVRLHPIIIKERMTLSELGTRVTTAERGKSFQLAIYASDPITKLPTGNALGATGSLSAGTTGVVTAAISGGNITLNPGMYWVALNTDTTTAVFQAYGANSTIVATLLGGTASQVSSGTTSSVPYLSVAQAFGTWPDLTGQTFNRGSGSSVYAAIFFRVA